jgi:hypothetical protein
MAQSEHETDDRPRRFGRRRFLSGIGMGAAGAAGAIVLSDVEALGQTVEGAVPDAASADPRFGRMFNLPAFANPTSTAVRNAMTELGRPGGLLDAKDPLHEGPVRLITNPELSPNNRDNLVSSMTAGTTFVGQFLDHDVTFDTTSRLAVVADPAATPNTRDARIDLDSVYGGGPSVSPQLYSSSDRAKFRIESGGLFEDLPRNSDRTAIIADPRNDENLMIAGLHAAFLLAHNRTVDFRRANNLPGDVWFYSRRTVIHHWQWIVVHEFLPQIVGQSHVNDIFAPRTGRTCSATGPPVPERPPHSSGSSSTRPARGSPIRSTCAGGPGPGGASSAGRRSSTSAGTRPSTCGRTSGSTRASRHRCSTYRCRRSRAATRRPRWRRATCCGT